MFFQKEQREKIKKDNPTLKTLPQLAKKMGEIWGLMNDEQKKVYFSCSFLTDFNYFLEISRSSWTG